MNTLGIGISLWKNTCSLFSCSLAETLEHPAALLREVAAASEGVSDETREALANEAITTIALDLVDYTVAAARGIAHHRARDLDDVALQQAAALRQCVAGTRAANIASHRMALATHNVDAFCNRDRVATMYALVKTILTRTADSDGDSGNNDGHSNVGDGIGLLDALMSRLGEGSESVSAVEPV